MSSIQGGLDAPLFSSRSTGREERWTFLQSPPLLTSDLSTADTMESTVQALKPSTETAIPPKTQRDFTHQNLKLWESPCAYLYLRLFFVLFCCFWCCLLFAVPLSSSQINTQRHILTYEYLALEWLIFRQFFLNYLIYLLPLDFCCSLFYIPLFLSYSVSGCVSGWLAPSILLS